MRPASHQNKRCANYKLSQEANWHAYFGDLLRHEFFLQLNPMRYQRALVTEITLAEELRQEGFAVWQN